MIWVILIALAGIMVYKWMNSEGNKDDVYPLLFYTEYCVTSEAVGLFAKLCAGIANQMSVEERRALLFKVEVERFNKAINLYVESPKGGLSKVLSKRNIVNAQGWQGNDHYLEGRVVGESLPVFGGGTMLLDCLIGDFHKGFPGAQVSSKWDENEYIAGVIFKE